ncbi:formate/nitrite transporter [Halovivax asiaticus JCM 14624]|uniref:Formate/nitrite transporter n=1 Tax=Halovivax asiaticus JCM 14624 TaxID=1227490 RepID=M0BXD6_9EURY|nr:formate/nitrite transporter family protein [Halovivax asiaticus]ELZ14334.1 formate/nitrite transporter [Halovivax asiaticus JCM 14624]
MSGRDDASSEKSSARPSDEADQSTPPTDSVDQRPTSDVLASVIDSGVHEINRERSGLLLSGFSAGLDIGFGPLLMAVVLTLSTGGFGDLTTELLVASAYAVGFIFVIIGRSELFTEHTTLAVIPVLDGKATVTQLARLWGLVYVGNVLGGAAFTILAVVLMPGLGVVDPASFVDIASKLITHDPHWLLVAGIFAGWLMGLLAWLLTAAQDTTSRLLLIWIVTATIGLLHLPHSIAGNVEVLFGLVIADAITVGDYVVFLVLATIGNALGGGIFVASIKYGHVVRGGG